MVAKFLAKLVEIRCVLDSTSFVAGLGDAVWQDLADPREVLMRYVWSV